MNASTYITSESPITTLGAAIDFTRHCPVCAFAPVLPCGFELTRGFCECDGCGFGDSAEGFLELQKLRARERVFADVPPPLQHVPGWRDCVAAANAYREACIEALAKNEKGVATNNV